MRFVYGSLLLAAFGLCLSGCYGPTASTGEVPVEPGAETATTDIGVQPAATDSAKLSRDAKPDVVLKTFLDLLQSGEVNRSVELLTRVARRKTAEQELRMQPINGGGLDFRIGNAKQLTDDTAHVNSLWTPSGASFEIVWLMRKTDEGWRIAGMSTASEEGEIVFFNFEDPQDMMAKANGDTRKS